MSVEGNSTGQSVTEDPVTPRRQTGAQHLGWALALDATKTPKNIFTSRRIRPLTLSGAIAFGWAVPQPEASTALSITPMTAENCCDNVSSSPIASSPIPPAIYYNTWTVRKYIRSSRDKCPPLVQINVRPANATLPSKAWFVEHPVDEVYTWTKKAQVFREICVEELLPVPEVAPHPSLASLADSWTANSGVTKGQFALLCVRCSECGLYTSSRSFNCHQCPNRVVKEHTDSNPEYEDAILLFERFDRKIGYELGITLDELEHLFVECPSCGKIMTRTSAWYHDSEYHDTENHKTRT